MTSYIHLYQTPVSDCSYLDHHKSVNHIIDPGLELNPSDYDVLLAHGFRRSGEMVYRPACPECNACKSSRVPIGRFKPNRSQRRAWKKVSGQISIHVKPAEFNEEQYELYLRYTRARHEDGNMANSTPAEYMDFLTSAWSETIFLEISYANQLLAVAVTDRQPSSLSALYTFFDPDYSHLSPGVIAILSQIEHAKAENLAWLYLGYWIETCKKMSYKTQYRPVEVFEQDQWQQI